MKDSALRKPALSRTLIYLSPPLDCIASEEVEKKKIGVEERS